MDLSDVLTRAAGAATDAGGALLGRLQQSRLPGVGAASVREDPDTRRRRWRAVTVLCPPDRLDAAALPAPLAALGDRVEVRVRPAPADKGTELAVRFRDPGPRDDPGELRTALREAKQLVEVGELLRVEPQPHGRRRPTPSGRLVEGMAGRARKEGVL